MSKPKIWQGAMILALVVAVVAILKGDPNRQSVTLEFPGGKISIDSEQLTMSGEAMLDTLFATDFSRAGVLGWLAQRGIYDITDPGMVTALNTALCEPIPAEPITEQLAKSKECATKPSVAALRRLAESRRIPFHHVGEYVLAGVQFESGHRPGKGFANVCANGDLVARRLQVIDLKTNNAIEVLSRGTYQCTVGTYPSLQLDPDDASVLFQRPPAKYEEVIAVVL